MTDVREMVPMTEKELLVAGLCRTYDDLYGQLSDNHSEAGLEDLIVLTGMNRHQIAGIISSLEAKGYAFYDDEDWDILWLTSAGVKVWFWQARGELGDLSELWRKAMRKVIRVSAHSNRVATYRTDSTILNSHNGFVTVLDGKRRSYDNVTPSSFRRLAAAITNITGLDQPQHVKEAFVDVLPIDKVGYMLFVEYNNL